MLICAALYIDALNPPSFLSLCLQDKSLDKLNGIQHLLRLSKSLKTSISQNSLEWPTVKLVCSRVKEDGDKKVYKSAVVTNHRDATLKACADTAISDITTLESKLRTRLEWSDLKLLRAIISFLDTKGWSVQTSARDGGKEDDLTDLNFREPLEAKGVNSSNMQDEVETVPYARRYLNLSSETYQRTWYTSTHQQMHTDDRICFKPVT